MPFARLALSLALAVSLAACAEKLPPGGVAALDGVYSGDLTRSGGSVIACPALLKLKIAVKGGEARGEVFSADQPDAPIDRFLAYIESDGRITTAFRFGSQAFGVQGQFGRTSFTALADSRVCSLSAFARKES
jgi:hypothetical protein